MKPVAFLIQAHQGLDQLKRLVKVLSLTDCDVFIHFCANGHLPGSFQRELAREFPNVSFTRKRVRASWGSIGQVLASLELLEAALDRSSSYKYLTLLSGADYPIKAMNHIAAFFAESNKSLLDYRPLGDEEWHYGGLRRINRFHLADNKKSFLGYACRHVKYPRRKWFDERIEPYVGSNWWSLRNDAAKYALQTLLHDDDRYLRFFSRSYLPDEMVFQTVLANSSFKDDIDRENRRFVKHFSKKRDYLRLKVLGRNGICTLSDEHRGELTTSGALFARKFDPLISTGLLGWLDQEVHGIGAETT